MTGRSVTRILLPLLACLLLASPDLSAVNLGDWIRRQLRMETYNEIHEVQPQFSCECVQNCESLEIPDGGIGRDGFYCSDDAYDEKESFHRLTGIRVAAPGTPEFPFEGRSDYRFFSCRDRWRERRGDNRRLYIGHPQAVTNCHHLGGQDGLLFDQYALQSQLYSETQNPSYYETFRFPIESAFRNRNYIDDGQNFRYGRYFFGLAEPGFDVNRFVERPPQSVRQTVGPYDPYYLTPAFVDCPFGAHQNWGFRCAEMAKGGAYGPPPEGNVVTSGDRMHPDQWNLYIQLMREAVDWIGACIDQRCWGNLRPGDPHYDRETAGIVITIWEILRQLERQMGSYDGGSEPYQHTPASPPIRGYVGTLADGLIVGLEDSRWRGEWRIVVPEAVGHDLQAWRLRDSDPHYNVMRRRERGFPIDNPSYGMWSTLGETAGGLVERLFDREIFGNGDWLYNLVTGTMYSPPRYAYVKLSGHGAYMIGLVAHQLCHLHYREEGIPFQWGTPAAAAEERLAVTCQALVIEAMRSRGYLPVGEMRTLTYDPSTDFSHPASRSGLAVYFSDTPQGLNGISLAPLLQSMMAINYWLYGHNPEMARIAAHMVSECPMREEPATACIGGAACGPNPYHFPLIEIRTGKSRGGGLTPAIDDANRTLLQPVQPQQRQFQVPQSQPPGVSP